MKKKKNDRGLAYQKTDLKKIGILFGWGLIVALSGASLSSFFPQIPTALLAFLLIFFWLIFSFAISRLIHTCGNFYLVLSRDARTYLPFLLSPIYNISSVPLIWRTFLLILIVSCFFLLKGLFIKWGKKDIGQKPALCLLSFLTLLYILNYSWLSIIQYNAFHTGHWDLAGFDQVIWNTLQGKPLHTTMYGHNFLGEHMSPMLIILAPFYLIWADPRMLLILQSLFLGLGAIPVYLIAKDKLKHNLLSLSFSFAWLLHPFLSRVNLFEFHEIALAPFFLLFTFYFLQRRSWWLYGLFLFFSLMVKEDVSLIITALGIYAFFKINRRVGIITFIVGISWAYLAVKVLIPYIRVATGTGVQEASYGYFGRYTLGQTSGEIIKNLLFKPHETLKMLFLPINEKSATFFLLFLPVGLLSIISPVMLIALPEIILHFLAPWAAQYLLLWHYSAPITPFAIVAGIYGCSFWLAKKPQFVKNLSFGFIFYILASSILSNYYFGVRAINPAFYSPSYFIELYDHNNYRSIFSFPPKDRLKIYYETEKNRRLFEILKEIIPKDVPISAQDNLLAHFSQTKAQIYVFPEFKDAEYVILNTYGSSGNWWTLWGEFEEYNKGIGTLLQDTKFQVFFRDELEGGGIGLWGKKDQKEEIIKRAEKLVESNPSLPEAHFILGSIYFHTNNLKKAKEEIETALRLDPENTYAKQMLEKIP